MWISSSIKNRVSDRGRIDIFSRASISGWKASLLLLALASFSVVCAASDIPEVCIDRDPCFAKNSGELKEGQSDYIDFDKVGNIIWNATDKSPIELYSQECGKLSFNMSMPENLGDDCKFSMVYHNCSVNIEWKDKELKFRHKEDDQPVSCPDSELNVELNGANLACKSDEGGGNRKGFCLLELPQRDVNEWCKFDFAFNKKTGSCNGKIQFGEGYKLLATTTAPTTTVPEETNTTKGTAESGLSPWIIVGIVVAVLLLIAAGVGFIVFIICRRKRRGSAQNMIEKGNMVENANMVENGNAGIDCQCETAISSPVVLKTATSGKKSRSAKVKEPSKKTTDDTGEWLAAQQEEMKKEQARIAELRKLIKIKDEKELKQKAEEKKVPEPDTSRTVTTTPTPSTTNEVKDVEVKKDEAKNVGLGLHPSQLIQKKKVEAKNVPAPSGSSKKKVEAKNVPAPSGSSKKKKSEKQKDNHDKNAISGGKGQTE